MKKNEYPLVSIIVITYNSSKYVLETLESAKAQTYRNIELIVSDDGSTDNTVELCKKWLEENKDRFFRSEVITVPKNTGIPANCNRGVKAAKGEWVKLIAGDDALTKECIKVYVEYINQNPNIEILHSNFNQFENIFISDNKIDQLSKSNYKFNKNEITAYEQFQILLRTNPVNAATVFVKKVIFEKVGYFNEKFNLWEDKPMWLKITKNGIKMQYLDLKLINYRVHKNSIQVANSQEKIYTDYTFEKIKYLSNYYKYLPLYERILKRIEMNRRVYIKKIGFNNSNLFNKSINKCTGFIFNFLISRINNKYI